MGLFFKKMTSVEEEILRADAKNVEILYFEIFNKVDSVDALIKLRELLKEKMCNLLSLQHKYPKSFKKDTPEQAAKQMSEERSVAEKKFVDRYIKSLEIKLLNYKTTKGKTNNLNNAIEKFLYYKDEFLPETFDYFNECISKHFSNL